ncbi:MULTISPECIES: hypothetical protein [Vibrio]|jgi:hypothetical protein|uniref:Uncharacterized protein n=1 Tax=Vibrio diazotrophicus TaxID=685 RepID=A0A2J8I8G1_VIBDI|nr:MULTISPECIES: hypothetical protein [Vibrio]MCF7362069.1 hypothetical protein [Vibrio sp. A1-b2]MCZ4370311.1 hypothetical protein [Vibrio diazotrophicus]PNH83344.1 hypothetical protein C1N27_01835 [Vibrio diazotrophicus]PNH92203.1 hypothetical protein C1M59_11115 [Vibrio diazotrophicus]PNH97289.1 hypothetical protein C1O25_20555 [Vibrio diazotrophicus]
MNICKTGIAIAVSSLMASGSAWALVDNNDVLSNNTTYVDASDTTTTTTNTDLSDNNSFNDTNSNNSSTDVDLLSNNDTETNTLTSNDNDTDVDLLSNNTDNSVNNSGNSSNSASWTDNSSSQSYELSIDSEVVVANASLSGNVSGVGVSYGGGFVSAGVSVNNMNSLDGMSGAAGIVTVSQNSGANSLTQQAVTTNASLFTD